MALAVTPLVEGFNTSGATLALTVPAGGVPVGANIIAFVCYGDNFSPNSTGSVTDTAGNTYTALGPYELAGVAGVGYIAAFYATGVAALNAGDTITLTKDRSIATVMGVAYMTGAGLFDSASFNHGGNTGAATSITSNAPSVAGTQMIGLMGWQDATAATMTQDATWSDIYTNLKTSGASVRNVGIGMASLVDATTGTVTYAPHLSASNRYHSIVMGFLPATQYAADTTTGSYTIAGVSPTAILANFYEIITAVGTYAVTGVSPLMHRIAHLLTNVGTYAVTGVVPAITSVRSLSTVIGHYTVTGVSPLMHRIAHLLTNVGTYTVTGVVPKITSVRGLPTAIGHYTTTGVKPNITSIRHLLADVGQYTVTGMAALLLYYPAKSGKFLLRLAKDTLYTIRQQAASLYKVRQTPPTLDD